MKKFLTGLLTLFILAMTIPAAEAHCPRHRRARSYASRNYGYTRPAYYSQPTYEVAGYRYARKRSFYQRHKHAIDVGIGTGAGALIGGIARGGKGAGIGALIGAGSGALFTYVLDKNRRKY